MCDCCAVDELQAQVPELERLAKLAKPKLVKLAKPTRRQTIACSSSDDDEVPPARASLDASDRQAKPPVARRMVAAKAPTAKRKTAVHPRDTDLGRRISANGSRPPRERPAVDRRSTPGHSADVAIELDESGAEESPEDESEGGEGEDGEGEDGEGSEDETSGSDEDESDEEVREWRDAGADPHGFVLGGPSEGRKRPRQPRQPPQPRQKSLVGWFARARRRTRPVGSDAAERAAQVHEAQVHEWAVDADERPAEGFFMRRPRTCAPAAPAPHGRPPPTAHAHPHAAAASRRSRVAADAADAAEDAWREDEWRSAAHAAMPRARSLPRRGWRGFEAFALPRMETVAAAAQQAAPPATAAPAAPAATAAPAAPAAAAPRQ